MKSCYSYLGFSYGGYGLKEGSQEAMNELVGSY